METIDGHLDLLKYEEHIVGIKKISALLSGQIHKRDKKMYICCKCHSKFISDEKLQEHIKFCIQDKQNVIMPLEDTVKEYKSNGAEQFHPFTLTLDFECTLKKMHEEITETTKYFQKHEANSFAFTSREGTKLVRSDSVAVLRQTFVELLIDYGRTYNEMRKTNRKIWGVNWEEYYKKAQNCHICNITFNSETKKVADHDHFTARTV